MLRLTHGALRVDLLDPLREAARLGPRFCAGGYIWQVHDDEAGPLLSGPEGAEPAPDPFNGHGLPESFRERTRAGEPLLWDETDTTALAPGAGRLVRVDGAVHLAEPCAWHIEHHDDDRSVTFHTQHEAAGHHCALTRRITLDGRTLSSHSQLENRGRRSMRLQWFAHPFFALDADRLIEVALPRGSTVPADAGFTIDAHGTLLPARPYSGKDDGAFALLALPAAAPLTVRVTHARLHGGIRFSTSFAPSECPVWINGHTFSIEPYQVIELEPGEARTWSLRYEFGSANGKA